MRVARHLILAAVEAWVPPSPSAASAAGGWGKPVSRCVHRLGFGGSPAGGVWEVEELSVQILVLVRFPFGDGAPWGPVVTRATSRSPEIGGFRRLLPPRPYPGAADLDEQDSGVFVSALRGGGGGDGSSRFFGGGAGDLPSVSWWASTTKVGSLGSGASMAASSSSPLLGSSGPRCNFFLFLDLSVSSSI